MIKNLLMDMDMTILDFNMAEHMALKNALEYLGLEPKEEILSAYNRINISQWKLLEKGLLDRKTLRVRRFEILVEEFGLPISPSECANAYEPRLGQGYYYMDGAEQLLQELQGKYHMYILSNGSSSVQHSRIKGADLAKYFDDIFISEDVGYNKPDKRFFDVCFSEIEKKQGPLNLEETVMIGDSLTSDMQGGINAGVTTIWFNPEGKEADGVTPDYEIHSLGELPALLERI